MPEFKIDLLSSISGWPRLAEDNVRALGEAWPIATEVADLHSLTVQRISQAREGEESAQHRCIVLLGVHGLNLFLSIIELVAKGRFDIASHLLRALADCESLALAVGYKDELAKDFLDDKLRASKARKLVPEIVKSGDTDLAEFIDKRLKVEANAANQLSHVGLVHIEMMMDHSTGVPMPIVGGRADENLARQFMGAVIEHETWHLAWFEALQADVLGADWIERRHAISPRVHAWMKEVFGPTVSERLELPR